MSTPGLYNSRTGSAIKSKYRFFLCAFAGFFLSSVFFLVSEHFQQENRCEQASLAKVAKVFIRGIKWNGSIEWCVLYATHGTFNVLKFQRNLYALHTASLVCNSSNDFVWRLPRLKYAFCWVFYACWVFSYNFYIDWMLIMNYSNEIPRHNFVLSFEFLKNVHWVVNLLIS